ncbi:MAG TPA: hypothetical protein DD738_12910, partial [Ruminiclostridium sp.]|nr:hypothetical protein [Ruminiclostridium sp.]
MARLTSDIKRIGVSLSWHVVDFFWSIFLVLAMTILMLAANVTYALIVLSAVPDGVDYRERPLLWMYSNIGYVLQEPHLFSGNVRDNITYGRQGAKQEDIEAAAKIVNAHSFIQKLEKGYDTEVGERGNRLSTGQKQLVSFARAI